MIDTLVTDLITHSAANIKALKPDTIEDIYQAPPLIGFSKAIQKEQAELKQFLHKHLYRHYQVCRMSSKARRIISDLFQAFIEETQLLPPEFQERAHHDKPRAIADYIAGMTDRYAMIEHQRLFAVEIH
jgi:dGTPase